MMETLSQKGLGVFGFRWLKLCFCGWALIAVAGAAWAQPVSTENPVGFFTNVASRLLSSELNVDLHHIQIYPTNQYTPAVHRLLQVTANIYDAAANRYYDNSQPPTPLPTVFRPVFNVVKTASDTNVFICDFSEVTNAYEADSPLSVPWDLSYPAVVAMLDPGIHSGATAINVFGAPWIIGAKKGFPNFNELYLESAFQLTRKMLVTRASINSTFDLNPNDFSFFEMFNLSLTNSVGVEFWNSYRSNYTRPTDIFVNDYAVTTLTNDENSFSFTNNSIFSGFLEVSNWQGYDPVYNPMSARFSFLTNSLVMNFAAVPASMYRFNTPPDYEEQGHVGPYVTTNLALSVETNLAAAGYGPYPQPHWGMTLNNNFQAIMVDTNSGRIIDCVLFCGPNSSRDLFGEIQRWYDTGTRTRYDDLWDTNIQAGLNLPVGIANQFAISQGNVIPVYDAAKWGRDEKSAYDQINAFRIFTLGPEAFLLTYPGYTPDATLMGIAATTNQMQMPYTPLATVVQDILWQANDPLVHYMASDLVNPTTGSGLQSYLNWPGNLGWLNDRYLPWGGNPAKPAHGGSNPDNVYNLYNAYNLQVKDALVKSSDDWDFPTNQPLSTDWIGQVHRGTPWQTVYLKAADALTQNGVYGTNLWVNWTGDTNPADAAAMAPVQDWHLASLLASMLNTNDLRSLFSVNNPDTNAWQALLDGLTALTNSTPDNQVGSGLEFDPITISSNSPQAAIIANAIETARTAEPGQLFNDVGTILAVPQLTVNSPFLNWNDSVQQQKGISDEAYEIIPSQLLPRLRAESIGSVISVNGQVVIQYSGYDGHSYAIEVSSNLADWTSIATNSPAGSVLSFTNSPAFNSSPQFFRSVLLN